MPGDSVNQSNASAGRDVVAGNKNTTVLVLPSVGVEITQAALEAWVIQLQKAIEENDTISHFVRNLQYFHRKKEASDGIVGLEAKLKASGRIAHTEDAIDQKLEFERLLEEWSYYASAQEILAYLLAKVQRGFLLTASPYLNDMDAHALDKVVDQLVLEPIIAECAKIPHFSVNLNVALGMLYWLAEQCFVRWHK
ncbi:MAG TPA: ABC-three component system protein [Roseovarius sp.]